MEEVWPVTLKVSWAIAVREGWESEMMRRPRPASRPRVLVVARNPRLQLRACESLSASGFEARATDDALDALTTALRDPPELIIVAHTVRGLAVGYLLHRLKTSERTSSVPILALVPSRSRGIARICRILDVPMLDLNQVCLDEPAA